MKNILLATFFSLLTIGLFAQTKQVLFIGNSYTAVNNLPQLVKNVALSTGDTMEFVAHTPGGRRLMQHASDANLHTKIRSQNWDFVTIQAQSQEPSFSPGQVQNEVFPYAKILCDSIRANHGCSMPLFYMTWGRKNGDTPNCPFWPPSCTYQGMDSMLNLHYRQMANDNDALVSPVGAVWHYIRDNYPNIELYSGDGSHPSQAGSYAAACSFYSLIFQKDPTLITFQYTLTDSIADQIKHAAKVIAFDSLAKWNVGKYDPQAGFSFTNTDSVFTFSNQSVRADSFYWDFGDGNMSSEADPTHHYAMGGSYQVLLVVERCGKQDSLVQTISFIGTGIGDLYPVEQLEVFPNPSCDFVSISGIDLQKMKEILLTDASGKIFPQIKMTNENRLNVSNLSAGAYFLTLTDKQGKKYIGKILKK